MKIFRTICTVLMIMGLTACVYQQSPTADVPISDAEITSQLAGTVWVAEYIHGKPVIDMSHTSMVFTSTDSVSGSGACNRYKGKYELKDGTITFSPMASTMMMCPEAISEQEMRFFQSLSEPQMVSFENGMLKLSPNEGEASVFGPREMD